MNKTAMANIIWPKGAMDSVKCYMGFVAKIFEENSIDYSDFPEAPLPMVTSYLNGQATDEDLAAAGQRWRAYIEEHGYARDFSTPAAVKARLAWSAFAVDVGNVRDLERLWENISWVIEFCNVLSESGRARAIYRSYFAFRD